MISDISLIRLYGSESFYWSEDPVSRYDRYLLSQLLLIFGLFALILVGILWINHAVRLFDRLISDGHSTLTFLEFSALALPNTIRIALPIASFVATIYVTHRFYSESELTVMQATGSSPWRMVRPVLIFGVFVALMMTLLNHILLPASISQLKLRETEVAQYSSVRLLTEGTFLHPVPGTTFFVHSIDADGSLNDIFLSDHRHADETLTYTALRAYLFRDVDRTLLIMMDGLVQRLSNDTKALATTSFADFSYDITDLLTSDRLTRRSLRELSTEELLFKREIIATTEGYPIGAQVEELHLRFARSMVCIAAALLGFSVLQVGTFSRYGIWPRTAIAFICLLAMEIIRTNMSRPVVEEPSLWPLIYLPALLGLITASFFLWLADHPSLIQRILTLRHIAT